MYRVLRDFQSQFPTEHRVPLNSRIRQLEEVFFSGGACGALYSQAPPRLAAVTRQVVVGEKYEEAPRADMLDRQSVKVGAALQCKQKQTDPLRL